MKILNHIRLYDGFYQSKSVTTQVQSSLVHGSEVCGLTVILIRMESNED